MTDATDLRSRRVPSGALFLLAAASAAQVVFGVLQPKPVAQASALPLAPVGASRAVLKTFEPLPSAYMLDLYLQAFDNQPGISIPFRDLDYARVTQWLQAALEIDPVSQYPMLMAAMLYADVPDTSRLRYMLDFIYRQYLADPDRRWQWLAHAAILAKHRLHDLPLALEFSRALAQKSPHAPSWVRQMHIFLLEDMGEYEAARILLGGLLASGTVTDLHEQILLQKSLERIQAAEKSARPTNPRREHMP